MKTVAIAGYEDKMKNYAAAMEGVGLKPIVTLSPDKAAACDGLLLPGGGDVHPSRFGQENQGSCDIDTALDEMQFAILDLFVRAKKPVLGICRGHQLINVYFGGSLIQDLVTAQTHMAHDHEDSVHPVQNLPGSILHELYGPRMVSNSSHHQGLADIAPNLWVTAFAPDGAVEGAEHDSLPILGVQYHPERMCFAHARPDTADGGVIFRWFKQKLES